MIGVKEEKREAGQKSKAEDNRSTRNPNSQTRRWGEEEITETTDKMKHSCKKTKNKMKKTNRTH